MEERKIVPNGGTAGRASDAEIVAGVRKIVYIGASGVDDGGILAEDGAQRLEGGGKMPAIDGATLEQGWPGPVEVGKVAASDASGAADEAAGAADVGKMVEIDGKVAGGTG
jgi:hypothetical protein